MSQAKPRREMAAAIVSDAGGKIVGRTRLQKIAYLLELAGVGEGFDFEYKHYGPYSEELATAVSSAVDFDLIKTEDKLASWGGWYSIYEAPNTVSENTARQALAAEATKIGAVELELAATAAYLKVVENFDDPWAETAKRKPEKVRDGRLEKARDAYRKLMAIRTPTPLPPIA